MSLTAFCWMRRSTSGPNGSRNAIDSLSLASSKLVKGSSLARRNGMHEG